MRLPKRVRHVVQYYAPKIVDYHNKCDLHVDPEDMETLIAYVKATEELIAACVKATRWHHDTCGSRLDCEYPCDCGKSETDDALAKLKEF